MTLSATEVDCVAKAILSERTSGHIDWRDLMEIFKNEYRDQAIAAIGAIAEIRTLRNAGVDLLNRAEAAEAERDRLKDMLEDAVKWMNGCVVSGAYPAWHTNARKALGDAS